METAGAPSWQRRGRAESFGAVAEEYDAVRPRYPEQVVRAVLAGRPASPPAAAGPVRVLDVGTGTGILARALVAAGAAVVGTDLDPAMAQVARRSGLEVHVAPFEQLDLEATFDRITVAQAWHWIEPEAGLAAARRSLAPGGQLWLIWNVGLPEARVRAVLDPVYARFADRAPGLGDGTPSGSGGRAAEAAAAWLAGRAGVHVETEEVAWRATHDRARYLRLLATHSDHATLPASVREELFAAVDAALAGLGGEVVVETTTRVVVASGLAR